MPNKPKTEEEKAAAKAEKEAKAAAKAAEKAEKDAAKAIKEADKAPKLGIAPKVKAEKPEFDVDNSIRKVTSSGHIGGTTVVRTETYPEYVIITFDNGVVTRLNNKELEELNVKFS